MSRQRPEFNYGGQAIIEGVMMRGAHIAAIAVRNPAGEIVVHEQPLNKLVYRGWVSKIPFVRGLIGLWDALVLGTRALMWSANVALEEEETPPPSGVASLLSGWLSVDGGAAAAPPPQSPADMTPEEAAHDIFSGGVALGVMATSLSLGVGLFFVAPAAASSAIGKLLDIDNRLALDAIEGGIKLAIFIGYIAAIGMMEDVKRLFGYHGAEHKTINAYEAGDELTPAAIKKYPLAHPRCGTAFLLTVVVLSIFVHALTGRPGNFFLLILSRVLVIPIIAGLAYEVLRFTARHASNPLMKLLIVPNLALQRLTTREPDESMIEVAIEALQRVVAVEEGIAAQTLSADDLQATTGLAASHPPA